MFIGTTGRHLSLLSSPNGTPRHYRATLTPIIVAQGYWPDIFTHFTNPSLTQKPRLFTTSLQARTLRRHLSLLSSPNDVHRHSRATLTPIIVAQRYSLALPGDTFRPLLSPNDAGLTSSLTSPIPPSLKSLDSSPPPFKPHSPATFKPIIVAQRCSSALPGDT